MVYQLQKKFVNFVVGGAWLLGISNLALYVNTTASALLWSFHPFNTSFYFYLFRKK